MEIYALGQVASLLGLPPSAEDCRGCRRGVCQREREALPPPYLVKFKVLECRAKTAAPTALPRSPRHNVRNTLAN